jgi:hypothetical protein
MVFKKGGLCIYSEKRFHATGGSSVITCLLCAFVIIKNLILRNWMKFLKNN